MEYQPNDDRYTTAQNNAGVHSFITIGNYDQALHHFRQALAAKLTTENRSLQSTPVQQDHRSSFVVEESSSNDESIVEESQQRCVTPELPEDNATPFNCRNMESRSIENTGYIPYLYLHPFTINKSDTETNMNDDDDDVVVSSITPIDDVQSSMPNNNTTLESTRMSLIIIFNVALVYHIMNRSSTKAYYMYKIAMALLLSLPRPNDSTSLLLHAAVLNNFGIWCYENNEYDAMTLCFEEIIELFDDIYQDDIDDDDGLPIVLDMNVKRGIFANLRACLPP